jgi:DNA invertase Pin-like site-specific DNA recombinase
MRVFSYLRFSSPEQARGDSFRRQTEEPEIWCKERGLELDNSLNLRDLGRSAFRGGNAQFGALRVFLDLVESGRIERGSILLVESLDRLSREAVLDASARLLDLIRAGITVVTLSDGQEYSESRLRADWTPLIMSLLVMARAHEESVLKSQRVGKAWAQKRLKAQETKQAQTAICPGWMRLSGNPRSGSYELIPDRVEIVRRIFAETIGGHGRRAIAKRLNAEEVPTWGVGKKRGTRWHDSYVQKILNNPAAFGVGEPLGKVAGGDGSVPTTPIAGYYPAAIDEETFYAAQAASKANGTGSGRPGAHRNSLRGIAKCAACGANMVVVDKGVRSSGLKLICGAAHASAGCTHRAYYRYATTEMSVVFGLGQQKTSLIAAAQDQESKLQARRTAQVAKRDDLQRRLNNLIELVKAGGGGATVAGQVADLQMEIDTAAAEIRILDREAKIAKAEEPGIASSELAAIYARLSGLDGEEAVSARAHMAQRMKALVERIEFSPAKVTIRYANGSVGAFMPIVNENRKQLTAWLPGAQSITRPFNGD